MKLIDLDKLLPADIPAGERVLWFGRPEWMDMARRAYRGDWVAAYFGVMCAWDFVSTTYDFGVLDGLVASGRGLIPCVIALALLALLAWLSARTTLYVITSRRVVMKVGIALPIFFNIPFLEIASAAVHVGASGAGDIPLVLAPGRHIAYLNLWPHARPFHFANPQPALRSVPGVADVAETLRRALIAEARERLGEAGQGIRARSVVASGAASFPSAAVTA